MRKHVYLLGVHFSVCVSVCLFRHVCIELCDCVKGVFCRKRLPMFLSSFLMVHLYDGVSKCALTIARSLLIDYLFIAVVR